MKNFSFFKVLFLALAIFGISSCGSDDTTDTDFTIAPTVSAEITSVGGADVAPGGTFTVQVVAAKGDSSMTSLAIKEAGANIDAATRLLIDGIDPANNPQIIPAVDADAFTWNLTVTAHSDEAEVEYTFEVTDKAGNVEMASLLINTVGQASPPVVDFVGMDPVSVTPGSAAIIKINATASSDIASIGVWVGGALVDLTAETIDYEGTPFDANPQLLAAGSTSLTEAAITIRPTATGVYTFQVTDVNGLTGEVDVNVLLGTPISSDDIYTGILVYNNSGPEFGGLDLDTGSSVSSMDAAADLIDSGNVSQGSQDWLKQIEPTSGVTIREVPETGTDLIDYNAITTSEAVVAAYDSGSDVANTETLEIGSVFTAQKDGVTYLLQIGNIVITDTDNEDYYEINIKRAQ